MESIEGVQFSTLSTEDIRKISVVQVVAHDVFDKGVQNMEVCLT